MLTIEADFSISIVINSSNHGIHILFIRVWQRAKNLLKIFRWYDTYQNMSQALELRVHGLLTFIQSKMMMLKWD